MNSLSAALNTEKPKPSKKSKYSKNSNSHGATSRDGSLSAFSSNERHRVAAAAPTPTLSRKRKRAPSSLSRYNHLPNNNSSYSSKKNPKCCFCNSTNAALIVHTALSTKPLCLLHYYTTRSCLVDPSKVTPILPSSTSASSVSELQIQLPPMQDLFTEAFTELQTDIAEESKRVFEATPSDPFSIIGADQRQRQEQRKGIKMKIPKPSPSPSPFQRIQIANDKNGGGFMPQVAGMEQRRLDQQQKQMDDAAKESKLTMSMSMSMQRRMDVMTTIESNPYKRRKPVKTSIWNLAMGDGPVGGNSSRNRASTKGTGVGGDNPTNGKSESSSSSSLSQGNLDQWIKNSATTCAHGFTCPSCKSTSIESDGNVTGRNEDVPKAETWGTKRENEVVVRCRCLDCGRVWNEEE